MGLMMRRKLTVVVVLAAAAVPFLPLLPPSAAGNPAVAHRTDHPFFTLREREREREVLVATY